MFISKIAAFRYSFGEICGLGSGKGKLRRSIFAVRGPRDSFGAERFDPSLVVESSGFWTLIYRKRGLFEPEEIRALIAGL
jgi:hypothetical protein